MNCDNDSQNQTIGADPYRPVWKVVRGDSAKLRIEFYQSDEVTYKDTSTWTYSSSAYNPKGEILDTLTVDANPGYVDIVITPEISSTWGIGYNSISAELAFDLQVTIDGELWTPVIGTIVVISDVTGVA